MRKIILLWGPVVIWAGGIFFISSMPGLSSGLDYDFLLRKMAHVTEYFILTFLLYRALKETFVMDSKSLFFYPVTFSYFYAVSDEFHQLFVFGRHGSLVDTLIDLIGILGFYLFIFLLKKVFKSN